MWNIKHQRRSCGHAKSKQTALISIGFIIKVHWEIMSRRLAYKVFINFLVSETFVNILHYAYYTVHVTYGWILRWLILKTKHDRAGKLQTVLHIIDR